MEKIEDHFYRVSADFEKRDDAERFKTQIENMQSIGPLAMLTGVSQQEAIVGLATSLTSEKQSVDAHADRAHLASTAVNACIAYLENEIAHRDRHIAELERDLADLRAAQSLADPAGAHPYRSAAHTAALGRSAEEAPSRPVAASEAAPTHSSASGGWRRVYGALRWAPAAGTGLLAIGFVHQSVTAPDSALFRAAALGMLIASLAGLVGALALAWRVTRAARAGVER